MSKSVGRAPTASKIEVMNPATRPTELPPMSSPTTCRSGTNNNNPTVSVRVTQTVNTETNASFQDATPTRAPTKLLSEPLSAGVLVPSAGVIAPNTDPLIDRRLSGGIYLLDAPWVSPLSKPRERCAAVP